MDKVLTPEAVSFSLNGQKVDVRPPAGERLSVSLRERLGTRDVKVGCDAGDCGACTVLIDGAPVCACLTSIHQADGCEVETQAGLVDQDPVARQLARSFEAHGAAQCGICTPGMMVSAIALLRETANPTETEVCDALGGVLCRCTGYRMIVKAVLEASRTIAPAASAAGPGFTGAAIERLDGYGKVTGSESFGDDVAPPEALVIEVIRSPYHRAGFRFGDVEEWIARTPGIEAVLTATDIPGINRFGVIPAFADQPVFAEAETRFRGEAVAAIVGSHSAIADFDEADFPVEWDERPSALSMEAAQQETANALHEGRDGNIMCGGFVARGDPEKALDGADAIVEGAVVTAFVEHAYIEPEAGFAEIKAGRIEVHACTQAPTMDLESLAEILDMDCKDIRVVPTGCGGGFGSKLDLSVQPYLALAALKTGQPVRINYSRAESMQSTTKRHPTEIRASIGATKDGRLSGMIFEADFNTGAYASWGPTVANRVPVHASGPYRFADYRARSRAIHTNCPPSGAFRGFGVPQSAVAQECLFDELADKLGIDRLTFRIQNALGNGDPTVCGQVFKQGVGIRACLEALRPAWDDERNAAATFNASNDGVKRGVGVAAGWYGCGNTSLPNPIDHQVRCPGRWAGCPASGCDGYRPGREHRHHPDLRAGARDSG